MELGRCIRGAGSCGEAARRLAHRLGAVQVAEGTVAGMKLETREGLDVGDCEVGADSGNFLLSFCNEFICMERTGGRLATFPDLSAVLHQDSGLPLTTAEIREGMPVALLTVPRARLNLGAGMRDPALFGPVERMTGKEIVKYLLDCIGFNRRVKEICGRVTGLSVLQAGTLTARIARELAGDW